MTNIKKYPTLWFLLLFTVGTLLLSACIAAPVASGNITKQEMDFEDFDEVEVSDAFTVQIRQGDEYRVTIEVNEESLNYLDVNQRGDRLEIGLLPRPFFFFWAFTFRPVLRAEVTMPTLVSITARDASNVDVSGFSTDEEVRIEVSDASSLEGDIETGETRLSASDASEIDLEGNRQDIEIEASDSSEIRLVGEGRNATIRATDASEVDLSDFPLQNATIEARDASDVTVDLSGTLDAEASDASHVTYYGEPAMGHTASSDGSSIVGRQR
jgi:hypothetical protein